MLFRNRKLRLEPLEDRRVLTSVVVTNNLDTVDGDTSSLAALELAPGDDGISIREAIEAANNTPGADEITFDFGHDGPEVILLTAGELLITDELTITGDGPELLTIDAQQHSRVINFAAESESLTLTGLTVARGFVTGDAEHGAGIRFESTGVLSLTSTTVAGNSGAYFGGGIYVVSGSLMMSESTLEGNSAQQEGGGLSAWSSDVTITGSSILNNFCARTGAGISASKSSLSMERSLYQGNETNTYSSSLLFYAGAEFVAEETNFHSNTGSITLDFKEDGVRDTDLGEGTIVDCDFIGNDLGGDSYTIAVYWGAVSIQRSNINGNAGGALYGSGDGQLEIADSTISQNNGKNTMQLDKIETILRNTLVADNHATFYSMWCHFFSHITLENTTIANNLAGWQGGAMFVGPYSKLAILNSTIVQNAAPEYGGIFMDVGLASELTIRNSLIAGNRDLSGNAPDLGIWPRRPTGVFTLDFSLIGNTTGSGIDESTGVGNLLNVDPHLGPLADHGGPTMTHALLPGSPAIDAGDPTITYNPMEFDQRGEGFPRVANAGNGLRIDMGAYESQGVPDYPVGDYNHDGIANLADYVVWRNHLGSTMNLAADGSGNQVIDAADYTVWREHFGNTQIPLMPVGTPTEAAFALFLSPTDESDTGPPAATPSKGAAEARSDGALLLLRNPWRPSQRRADSNRLDSQQSESKDLERDAAAIDQSFEVLPILR